MTMMMVVEEVKKGEEKKEEGVTKRRRFKTKTMAKTGWIPHESMKLPQDLFYWKSSFEILQISTGKLGRNEDSKLKHPV